MATQDKKSYSDNTNSPGSCVACTRSGRCKVPAGQVSIVITNTHVYPGSTVSLNLEGSPDATLTSVNATAAMGYFTITGNAAATADVQVLWSL